MEDNTYLYPSHSIWRSLAPSKIKVFIWILSFGKVNTAEVLQKQRPASALSLDWCVMCKHSNETTDHLFLHCNFARAYGPIYFNNLVFSGLGLEAVKMF